MATVELVFSHTTGLYSAQQCNIARIPSSLLVAFQETDVYSDISTSITRLTMTMMVIMMLMRMHAYCTHKQTCTHTRTHKHTRTHTHRDTMYPQLHTRTQIHANKYTCIHTRTHAYIHKHSCTHINTLIYTHIHAQRLAHHIVICRVCFESSMFPQYLNVYRCVSLLAYVAVVWLHLPT